jgi:putative membrane protein
LLLHVPAAPAVKAARAALAAATLTRDTVARALAAPDRVARTLAPPAITGTGPPLPPFDPRVWEYHNSTIVGLLLLASLYLYALGPYRRRARITEQASRWQIASFFTGLVITFFALNGPIHDLSDSYLFSVHMVQHLILSQLMPPLLLLGVPAFMWRAIVRPAWVQPVARLLSRPPVAFALYAVCFSAWHLQPAYDLMMRNHNVHIVTHLQFMVTAVILWWPVVSPLPEYPRMAYGPAMLYLFLASIPMMFVGALITLADHVLYPWYASAPRVWGLSPLDDQKLGGLIMWVPGGLYYWAGISVLFFLWSRRERRRDEDEELARASEPGEVQAG